MTDTAKDKPYAVNYWCSKPGTNDDCNTGEDYATEAEALKAYADAEALFATKWSPVYKGEWFELDGPGIHQERPAKSNTPCPPDDDSDWQSEIAMQAGMAFGCDGYNDAMGY